MCIEINLGLEDDKFFLHALSVRTQEVIFPEVVLQIFVVKVVLWPTTSVSSFADVTFLMSVSTVYKELVVTIEALPAKCTFGMTFKSCLVNSSRVVVTELFVFLEIFFREELMLVSEDLLVPCAEIAHPFVVYTSHMAMQVWPA
jgi:hypothetical protein